MKLNLSNMAISLRIAIMLSWIGISACEMRSQYVRHNDIPNDLMQTTLLVEKFREQDPMVYDPVYLNGKDSLWRWSGFKDALIEPDMEEDEPYVVQYVDEQKKDKKSKKEEEEPIQIKHPLIVKTNRNIEKYNDNLIKNIEEVYPGPVILIDSADDRSLDSMYANLDKYRYILKYKPVAHCFKDPNGETILQYAYMYYFYDRKDKLKYPDIELFSTQPWKTTRAILLKAASSIGG